MEEEEFPFTNVGRCVF